MALALLVLVLSASGVAGCGQRIRYRDSIQVPLTVPGSRANPDLLDHLSPVLLLAVGGNLPEIWPEDAPRLTEDLILPVTVPVVQADLGQVGADLAGVRLGDAEARLRRIDFVYESRTLTHPLVGGEVWVVPAEDTPLDDPAAHRVGTLTGLELGVGELIFQPGGRFALAEALAQTTVALNLQLVMTFDTGRDRRLPAGEAILGLTIFIDVLR